MNRRSTTFLLLALPLFLPGLSPAPSRSQTDQATQSETLVWDKPHHFWYRKVIGGSNVWIGVDAEHAAREPLFDHQRLAIEMTLRSGIEYEPSTLPLADPAAQFVVKYDGANAYIQQGAMAIEFVHGNSHWRCELQIKWDWNKVPPTDYECLPRRPFVPGAVPAPSVPGESEPVTSPDGKWEASIRNNNVVLLPAGSAGTAVVLSKDGLPGFAYQRGSIRWSSDSRSVHAYRVSNDVWRSNSVSGSVKGLVMGTEWRVAR